MRSRLRFPAVSVALALALAAPACKGESAPAAVPPAPTTVVTVYDAAPPPDGVTTIGGFDPASGMHLDDDSTTSHPGALVSVHSHRTLEILLRSQPSGATVAVDGVIVGQTPTYWEGEFTGREREFTFVMSGYGMARYRLVPTTNGIVHGRLTKIATEQAAGAPAIPRPVDLTGPSTGTPTHPDAGSRPPTTAPTAPTTAPTPTPTPPPLAPIDAGGAALVPPAPAAAPSTLNPFAADAATTP